MNRLNLRRIRHWKSCSTLSSPSCSNIVIQQELPQNYRHILVSASYISAFPTQQQWQTYKRALTTSPPSFYIPRKKDQEKRNKNRHQQGKNNKHNKTKSGGGKSKQSSTTWKQRHVQDPYVHQAKLENRPSRAIYKLQQIDQMAMKYLKLKLQSQQQQHKKGGTNKKRNNNDIVETSNLDFRKGMFPKESTVVDLGAAPGSWSMYVAEKIGPSGTLIAVDLLELDPHVISSTNGRGSNSSSKCHFHPIQGDFTFGGVKEAIINILSKDNNKSSTFIDEPGHHHILEQHKYGSRPLEVDCIISDMAANFTGDRKTDALRTMNLCEDALMFAIGSSCFDEHDDSIHHVSPITASQDQLQDSIPIQLQDGLLRKGGTFLCKYFSCGREDEHDLITATKRHFEHSIVLKPKASRKESAELYLYCTGFKRGS